MENEFHYSKDFIPYSKRLSNEKLIKMVALFVGLELFLYFTTQKDSWDSASIKAFLIVSLIFLSLWSPFILVYLLSGRKRIFTSSIVLSNGSITIQYYDFNTSKPNVTILLSELELIHQMYTDVLFWNGNIYGGSKNENDIYTKLIFNKKDSTAYFGVKRVFTLYAEKVWLEDETKSIFSVIKTLQGKPVIY